MNLRLPADASDDLARAVRLINRALAAVGRYEDGNLTCQRFLSRTVVLAYRGSEFSLTSELAKLVEEAGYYPPTVVEPGALSFAVRQLPRPGFSGL